MKKLIMTMALLFTVTSAFAEVGQRSDNDVNCEAISGAQHDEGQAVDQQDVQVESETTIRG